MDIDWNSEAPLVDSGHADDYFVELCALASTGTLTPAEWQQLETHLRLCANCRAIKAGYDRVVSTTLPAMAANRENADDGGSPGSWSLERAEAALLERIERENTEADRFDASDEKPRRSALIAIAAGLIVVSSLVGYRLELQRKRSPAVSLTQEKSATIVSPVVIEEPKASQFADKPDKAMALKLDSLQRRLNAALAERAGIEDERLTLLSELKEQDDVIRQNSQERADLEARLSVAQDHAQALQGKLDTAPKASETLLSAEILQKRVNDLVAELEEKSRQVSQAQELLAHDRDIRNLMGARDLYIGEIYDVGKSGKTQKPFGRVFYTQGKSLVFYAYDLDLQPGVKLASTFQAWGRRGVDQEHDVSLGVFYQDDQNKKRWVLKSNDSAMLSQLDAIFVTVEPHGASSRPTSRPLLFTYLKLPANHP